MNERSVPVGVVVVNWNGADDTLACLASLLAADPRPARVIVVDNASADDSVRRLEEWAESHALMDDHALARTPWLQLLRSRQNLGFAGGNNLALPVLLDDASVRDILLLNNDATVPPDFFARMEAARSMPRAGILGPTIYHLPERGRVWYAGGRAFPLRALVKHVLRVPKSSEPQDTAFVTGCAMWITGHAVRALGPLPRCYDPGYMEDAEYAWRARAAGFRVLHVPTAIAYHRVGTSFAKVPSPRVAYTLVRNRTLWARRNLRTPVREMALAYLLVSKPLRAFVELLRRKPALARAFWSGLRDGLRSPAGRERVSHQRPDEVHP